MSRPLVRLDQPEPTTLAAEMTRIPAAPEAGLYIPIPTGPSRSTNE